MSASRASAASQSVSCSRSRPAQQLCSRPQITPRSPSPMPVPRPPRTSVYWSRHFQMLGRAGVRVLPEGSETRWCAYPLYSSSSLRMDRPQGSQSEIPSESHLHMARFMSSDSREISRQSRGLTRSPMWASAHAAHSRRWRSRRTTGAGGFMAQFCGKH